MALPTKRITVFTDEKITLTGLSCSQVEQLMSIGKPDEQGMIDPESATKRAEFTVSMGTGIDFGARKKDYTYDEYYGAFNLIHDQMLELSGLKKSTPGETLAVVEKSTSSNSAAA